MKVLVWSGRVLAAFAFFLPYGPVLSFAVLALAELLWATHRQGRALETLLGQMEVEEV